MSTKSMVNNIHIHKKEHTKALIIALEHAVKKKSKNVILNCPYEEIQGHMIKDILSQTSHN